MYVLYMYVCTLYVCMYTVYMYVLYMYVCICMYTVCMYTCMYVLCVCVPLLPFSLACNQKEEARRDSYRGRHVFCPCWSVMAYSLHYLPCVNSCTRFFLTTGPKLPARFSGVIPCNAVSSRLSRSSLHSVTLLTPSGDNLLFNP